MKSPTNRERTDICAMERNTGSQMNICCLIAFFIFLAVSSSPTSAQVEMLKPIELPSWFQYPNGIAQTPDGALLIGSVVSGQILKIDSDGKKRFAIDDPSVFAGTTLKYDRGSGRLWGASPDFLGVEQPDGSNKRRAHRIFARDVETGAVDIVMLVPDGGFANDIAVGENGSLFITDTSIPRILTLPPDANRLSVLIADNQLASNGSGINGIGAAGIAVAGDGHTLLVGVLGSGTIFAVESTEAGHSRLRRLELQRPIENPDGFVVASNGDLLLVESGIVSGNGKLTRIVDPLSRGPRPVETLAENLDVPVNLMIDMADPSLIYVTESGLGHRFTESRRSDVPPERFYVRRYRIK